MAIESATVRLLAFVNEELLAGTSLRADEETPLFDQGWIDSLKILKLIAYVETLVQVQLRRLIKEYLLVEKHALRSDEHWQEAHLVICSL